MNQTIKIDSLTLYKLITTRNSYSSKEITIDGYMLIERKIESADEEDGGGHYEIVLKNVETNKFYLTSYTDWDIENTDYDEEDDQIGKRCDLNCNLREVVPESKTITIYKFV